MSDVIEKNDNFILKSGRTSVYTALGHVPKIIIIKFQQGFQHVFNRKIEANVDKWKIYSGTVIQAPLL